MQTFSVKKYYRFGEHKAIFMLLRNQVFSTHLNITILQQKTHPQQVR